MSHLDQIRQRHRADPWRDVGFLVTALLLLALAICATTSTLVGTPSL